MRRKTWVLAGVLVVTVIAALGGVVVSSSSTQPAHAAQRRLVDTATVQKEELSATVSENGILTYQAQADGSPYMVINEARGAFTELPAVGQVIRQGEVLYQTPKAA